MGGLAGRIGPRLPLTIGPLVLAAGFLAELQIGPGADYWTEMLPAIGVISIVLASAVAPLTTAVLASSMASTQLCVGLEQRGRAHG